MNRYVMYWLSVADLELIEVELQVGLVISIFPGDH